MGSYVRISALLWADILVSFALFVMQNYLTRVWKISFVHAAGILNIWGGISMILPVFFLFIVDTVLGNRRMLVISSICYSLGIGLVTMSTPPALAGTTGWCKDYDPKCIHRTHKVLFYTGMSLIAVGVAGNLVSVKPFLEEQRGENEQDTTEGGAREFYKLPVFIVIVIVPIVASFALPYVKPWSLRFGIPAICTAFAMILFLSGVFSRGSWAFNEVQPQGSPLTSVCRVFFAASCKIFEPLPLDARYLYKEDGNGNEVFTHTRTQKCLEKAAIILADQNPENATKSWKLCSISEVEDAKVAVRMLPMSTTFIVCGIVSSFGNTYFIEQANRLNRKLGNWNVPLQVLLLLSLWAKSFFFASYAKRVINIRKYGPPMGIAVAMIFSILCCITAAKMELRRLKVIEKHGLLEKPESNIPMSVFWLLFQFFLLAGLDTFFEMSVAKFYKDQSPRCMSNYLSFFARGVSGLGFMSSVLSVYAVGKLSEVGGNKSWFQATLNKSRLDRYYWVLAGLSSVNLVAFVLVARCYRYKEPEEPDEGVGRLARGTAVIPPDENGSNQFFNLFG